MSKSKRYTQEFKEAAVKQITERGYSVAEVAERLDICTKTLYHWRRQLSVVAVSNNKGNNFTPSKVKFHIDHFFVANDTCDLNLCSL